MKRTRKMLSERTERLGEDKFVSSGDTMKILRFFSKNPDAEQQYGGQLKDYMKRQRFKCFL